MGCTVYVHCLWTCGYSRPSMPLDIYLPYYQLWGQPLRASRIFSAIAAHKTKSTNSSQTVLQSAVQLGVVLCLNSRLLHRCNFDFLKYLRPNPITYAQNKVVLGMVLCIPRSCFREPSRLHPFENPVKQGSCQDFCHHVHGVLWVKSFACCKTQSSSRWTSELSYFCQQWLALKLLLNWECNKINNRYTAALCVRCSWRVTLARVIGLVIS